MDYRLTSFILGLLFIGSSLSKMADFDPSVDSGETITFADYQLHTKVELHEIGQAGFATGFILFVIIFIFANVSVVLEELKLHRDFN